MSEAADNLTSILGLTATVTTIGQFLSGIPTVQKVIKNRSAGNISPVPFLLGTVGCALWLAYARIIDEPMVICCNIVGTFLNAVYVLVFLRFANDKAQLLMQITAAGAFIASVLWTTVDNTEKQQTVENLGIICSLVTITCCASPLFGLKEIVRTKSTESLPFPLIFSTFVVCILWLIFGIRTGDKYCVITNSVAGGISVIQLSLFAVYPASSLEKRRKDMSKKSE